MNLPDSIPHSIDCPCGQIANLEWQYPSALHKFLGLKHLSYYCKDCKNSFTTTSSDEVSMCIFNSKKRSLKRKNKIKKII